MGCCPTGYTCVGDYCQGSDHTHPILQLATLKTEPKKVSNGHLQDVPCGNGKSCPDGYFCCSNGVGCCPTGYTCVGDYCQGSDHTHPILQLATLKTKPKKVSNGHLQDVPCGNGKSCPDGYFCCSNGVGCCPTGYTCVGDYCYGSVHTHPILQLATLKTEPKKVSNGHLQDVPCGNGKSCPDGYFCCSDGVGCCPTGYTCVGNYCYGSVHTHPILQLATLKTEPKKVSNGHLQDVPCGNGKSCPDGYFCCSNGVGCCPTGYTCVGDYCQGSDHTHPILQLATLKTEPKKVSNGHLQDVPCGNGKSCPDGYFCCSNGVGCCPTGYTCVGSYCQGSDHTHPILQLTTLKINPKKVRKGQNIHCPDGGYCADGDTCCSLANGGYGCCPHPNANCCSDGASCCPAGYSCGGDKHCYGSKNTHPIMNLLKTSSGVARNEV